MTAVVKDQADHAAEVLDALTIEDATAEAPPVRAVTVQIEDTSPPVRAVTVQVESTETKDPPVPAPWDELKPLPELVETAPAPFPMGALGNILGNAAKAIARDVQAPDALVAGSVLAAASLASQPLANILLPHGQRCPLSLFIVTAALSGDRKSAVDAVSCFEVEEKRRADARKYAQELQKYEQARASSGKGATENATPTMRSLTTGNATIEGLARLLKNQSSVGVFSAEGGELLGGHSLREERRMAGLAFFLKAWSGESLDSLRGGDGLTCLLGRRVALHLLAQPVVLAGLLADPLAQGQGLLARCLIAQPATLAGGRMYKPVDPHADPATQEYHARIRALLTAQPKFWEGGDGHELKPPSMKMDDDARAKWIEFFNQTERAQAPGGSLENARPFASKAAEHAARIAAVIATMEDSATLVIKQAIMEGAIDIVEFYINEHLRLTKTGREENHLRNLHALLSWLVSRKIFTNREIQQHGPYPIRKLKKDGIKPLLTELEKRNYIRASAGGWEVRNVQD